MTLTTLGTLFVVWIAAIVSPGPDLLQIIRVGSRSRAAGIWVAVGIMVGNTFWVVGSLAGLSALINTHPGVLSILQLIGGGYLAWMGVSSVRSWWQQRQRQTVPAEAHIAERADSSETGSMKWTTWQAVRIGIATNLSNPKAVLFFGAVFAQFIRPEMGAGVAVFISVFLVVTGLIWFIAFALLVRTFAAKVARNGAVIDLVAGVVFVGLGVFMVVEGAQTIIG